MACSLDTPWFNAWNTNSFRTGIEQGINSGDTAEVFLQNKNPWNTTIPSRTPCGADRQSMFVLNKGSSEMLWTKMNAEICKTESEERELGDWAWMFLHIICLCYHPLRYIIWVSQIAVILLKPLVGRFSWYSNIIFVNWCPITQKILFLRGYFNKIFVFWVSLG